MQCAISIYPQDLKDETREKIKKYFSLAKRYHVNQVFTSIHLPELTLEEQGTFLMEIAKIIQDLKMSCIADIGGNFIKELLENQGMMEDLKKCEIDYFRLDCGYDFNQISELYHQLKPKGFIINASMVRQSQIDEHLDFFHELDPNITIKACHNFYVRDESGLDRDFALSQSKMFEEKGVPVYYCVPSFDHPRGPLHLGLPTIEEHRKMAFENILLDLMNTYRAQGILFADEWLSESKFKQIDSVINKKIVDIPVELYDSCSEEEKQIVCGSHVFRYDSNELFLRSRSSREMAEFAKEIAPNHCIERKKGDITIDNENYLRYSGELQVVMKDATCDKRVNVVAHIKNEEDLQKFGSFREGITYRFIVE